MIPAFNEERRLPQTLDKVLAYLETSERSSEVIVVDDGSSDGTCTIAEDFARKNPRVRLLRNTARDLGKGSAIRMGMLDARGQWVLFSDADLSAPIEEVAKLLEAIRKHDAHVAIGSRALDRSLIGVHQSWARENAGRLFNVLMRIIVGLPFWDTQCGFKLYRADVGREVFERQKIPGFGFDVEALYLARRLGFKTVEVPVRWDHADGTKLDMFGDSARMFFDLLRVRWNSLTGAYRLTSTSRR